MQEIQFVERSGDFLVKKHINDRNLIKRVETEGIVGEKQCIRLKWR